MDAPAPLTPPGPNSRLSKMLPESLKPVTTLLPHHAVDVSLCVNPAIIENTKSADALEIGKLAAGSSGVSDAALAWRSLPKGVLFISGVNWYLCQGPL